MTAGQAMVEQRDRRANSALRSLHRSFGHIYARGYFSGVARQVLTVMAMVEAIFLAERFPMVFRDVLKNHANLYDTALLFLCNSSQIFDLALAIAILMAVYWTTLRMRENRELLVLFAAGIGPLQFIVLILATAALAMALSLTVSGVVDPASRYAQRVILFDAQLRVLQNGINTGQFYQFPNRVAFAPAQATAGGAVAGSGQTRRLFVYQQVKPGTIRIITSDVAKLVGPDASGTLMVKLGGVTSRMFLAPCPTRPVSGQEQACPRAPAEPSGAFGTTLRASDVRQAMTIDELLTLQPRGSDAHELNLVEQLHEKPDSKSPAHIASMRLLGERFSRSLLCLLAPLIALASVCLTSRRSNYVVLPLACMTLMALNVTSEWLIRAINPTSPLEALSVSAVLAVLFAVLLLTLTMRKQGQLIRPLLGRP
jgi:lipopolysaccharide export system permease protein